MTFATGEHVRMLDLTLPTFERYSKRHGYDLVIADCRPEGRPPSWGKIPALLDALAEYDAALWLDCDVAIVRGAVDLASSVPKSAMQAITCHRTSEGDVPNCGVWFVRQSARGFLAEVWNQTDLIRHVWWESAATMRLLGYRLTVPTALESPTEYYQLTHWLPNEWNNHDHELRPAKRPRFVHALAWPIDTRIEILRRVLRC